MTASKKPRPKRSEGDYCTNPKHHYGEHDITCVPPANAKNLELRLLRAIYGLCPDCNNTEPHEH